MITNANRDSLGSQQTTIASSTAETTIVTAAGTGISADLYGLIVTNTSSTYTKVTIKDSTGGTTRLILSVPAQETRGFTVPAASGLPQSSSNNNWTATCGTSVANIEVTALFARNV